MSEQLEQALAQERKANKRFSMAKNLFFAYLVVVTLFSAVQTVVISNQIKDILEQSRANGAANHQRTQDYVKCIAITLLKPVQERNTIDFDNCTANESKKSSVVTPEDQNNSVSSNGNTPAAQVPQIIIRDSTQGDTGGSSPPATTGSPPDPDNPTEESVNPADNSRVLTILDEILNEVDKSPVGGTLNKLGL